MDSALELKIELDRGEVLSDTQIIDKLQKSEIVKQLTKDLPEKPLSIVWRLICISEIPFSYKLDYTQKLIDSVYNKLATPYGFSLSGDNTMFLPCYNAMVVTALCRLNRANDVEVKNGLDWINLHQPMERGKKVNLQGFNFKKYGGCFEHTPCYIGLAKSVFALLEYTEQTRDKKYNQQLEKGISYMLEHKLFKRLSNDKPINKHITDISFPESYHLCVVELIRFAKKANILNNANTKELKLFFEKSQNKDGKWKNNFRYKADGYIVFDKDKNSSEWTTYIIKQSLNQ